MTLYVPSLAAAGLSMSADAAAAAPAAVATFTNAHPADISLRSVPLRLPRADGLLQRVTLTLTLTLALALALTLDLALTLTLPLTLTLTLARCRPSPCRRPTRGHLPMAAPTRAWGPSSGGK